MEKGANCSEKKRIYENEQVNGFLME